MADDGWADFGETLPSENGDAPPDPEEAEERAALASEGMSDAERVGHLESHALERIQTEDRDFELGKESTRLAIPERALTGEFPFNQMVRVGDPLLAELRMRKSTEEIDAVPTGFPSLNRVCMMQGGQQGFAHGWHVVLAAASNIGKTNVALNMVRAFLVAGEHVLLFALEEEVEDVATRIMAAALEKPLRFVTRGRHFDIEVDREASKIISDWPGALFINRRPVVNLTDIEHIIDGYVAHHNARTFVLDYLQLAEVPSARSETELLSRVREISDLVRHKAKTGRLLSICLSQLNRIAANNWKQCPRIYDLRGGGPIEQNADMVVLVDHCTKHYKEAPLDKQTDTEMIVGKNRKGIRGRFPIRFDWARTRCYELDPDRKEEVYTPQYPSAEAAKAQTEVFT